MSEHFEVFKEWVSTIQEDVGTLETIVTTKEVDADARRLAAAALCYLVQRMDLVPDWEESIGVLDDVMVIRQCVELASQHDLTDGLSDADALVAVGRLTNEAGRIKDFLGSSLHAHFRKHCQGLVGQSVRGRTPGAIVEDEDSRKILFEEVDREIRRMPAAPFSDPERLEVRFKAYLGHKLG